MLDFNLKQEKNIKCNIITEAYRLRCSSWKPSSKARIAEDFSTLLRIQQGEALRVAIFENDDFRLSLQICSFLLLDTVLRCTRWWGYFQSWID